MGLSLKKLGSQIYDQLNVFDNNRTFKQRTPTNNQSAIQQVVHVATPFVKAPVQFLNTGELAKRQIYDTGRQFLANATKNPIAQQNARIAAQNNYESLAGQGGGLFGQGTFFKNPQEAQSGAIKTVLPRIGGGTLETAATVAPGGGGAALRGASIGLRAAKGAAIGAATGGAYSAGQQLVDTGKVNPVGVIQNAAVGGVLGGGLPIASRVITGKTVTPKISELGGARPNNTIQVAIEEAHNRGDNNRVAQLITQLPEADQPAMRSALGISTTTSLPRPKVALNPPPTPVSTQPEVTAGKGINVLEGLQSVSPYTGAPKAPGAFSRAWQTVRGVISQHGTGGQEIARRLGIQRDTSEIGQQAFLEKIPTVGKLGKRDFQTFVQTLEKLGKGESVQVPPQVKQAIAEWNAAIPEIRNRAVQAGLDVGDLGPNYFPRQYKGLFTNDRAMSKLAQDMVDSGKAVDLGDAIGKLWFMKNEYQRPFGNLEKTRQFDLPGYEQTHDALINYVNRSFDRITKAEQFGAKNEILNQLQGRAQQEGFNAAPGSTLDKYIKIALGDVDKSTVAHKVSGVVRQINSLRSLSTAGLSNATQLTNTATVAGFGRTVKGIVKLAVSPMARAQARQTGVLLEHSLADLAKQGLGTGGKISRNIASPFFRQVEKFNRQATAIVGQDYGNALARKAATGSAKAVQTLREKFGVTGNIGKQLTREQEIQVSRKLVEISQFKVDPMDLPGWVDSPMGKLIAQFRTFGYKQTGFIWNEVLRQATRGNFLPLTRFIVIGTPLGAATLALKGKIKGTDYTQPNESNASKATKALAAVGAFGLPGSEGQNLYKSKQYGNTIGGLAGTVGGPTLSAIAETAANLDKKDKTAFKKEGVRNIPVVGPSIANRIFPKKQQTTEEKQKIDVAKQKETFIKSGKKQQTIGDTYWYKTKTGQIRSKPQAKHEFDLADAKNKLELDRAYEARDTNRWLVAAQQEYDALEKKKNLYDPVTEQDEIDKIILQQENLQQKAQGYIEKGINGSNIKPKSGKISRSSKKIGTSIKPAVSLNAGGSVSRPSVSVRDGRRKKIISRKKSIARSKPTVSLKKALV